MPRRCPVYAPHMPRIFKEAGHLRGNCGASMGQAGIWMLLSIFWAVLAIIRAKTNNIAKLSGPSRFEVKLEDVSAYKRKVFEGTVLRMRASSRKDTNI
jgi:hypothetical protein